MKRKLSSLILMALLPAMAFAGHVDPSRAQKAAQTFLNNNGAKAAQLTDLSKQAGFNNLYIFTAQQGFVVMAADDCVQPVLGYSLTGTFVAENMPTNVRGWLQGYDEEIQYAIDNQVKATTEVSQLWNDLVEGNSKAGMATAVVNNLLSTTWDQDPYYNDMCPYDQQAGERTVTGCVATAMAQIMKYWEHPSHGIGSHSYIHDRYGELSADYGNTAYNWSAMPNAIHSANTEIARLMYHCGVSVDMNYDISANGGSGAVTAFVANALQTYFNYQPCNYYERENYSGDWVNMLKAELDAARPLQYNGRGSAGGHSFVCCGYDSNDKFYFNWGWSGTCDGFYALNSLQPAQGGSGSAGLSFNEGQGAIFGIQPVQCTAAEPTDLVYTLSGLQNVTLDWTAASGAVSYNVYRNNNYIGNTSTPSYSEVAPFGTNVYYVRSVDANNNMSLSSNTVSLTIGYLTPVVDDLEASLSGNSVSLSWTAPEWCYPETESAMLTYGDGSINSISSTKYWAHRYLASDLLQYAGKAVYKVSFYAYVTGSYNYFIYLGSNNNQPGTLMTSGSLEVTATNSWVEMDLTDIVMIDGENDLWVVMNYPANGENGLYAAVKGPYSSSNNHGNYIHSYTSGNTIGFAQYGDIAWLIRTYLTDGIYTYNLYQDGERIAQDLNQTTYDATLNDNAANRFTVRTNYYGGETDDSNMKGFSLGHATIDDLEMTANDQMTVTDGSKLTVSGILTNDDPARLVIEDGGQLYTPNDVQGTIRKYIVGYGAANANTNMGYYLLASPGGINPEVAVSSGMVGGTVENPDFTGVDLYEFAQNGSDGLEWTNMRYGNQFALLGGVRTNGCLYANVNDVVLNLTPRADRSFPATTDDKYVVVSRSDNSSLSFVGWNLIGNPFTCDAYLYSGRDFYRMNATGDAIVLATDNCIKPCEGIFVVVAENDPEPYSILGTVVPNAANIRFTTTEPGNKAALVNIEVSREGYQLDAARVRFGEGAMQRKMVFNDKATRLSLQHCGTDWSVACGEGQGEMPVGFKASSNGTYTLSVDVNNVDLAYLHLIDNKTGADVDLLANPSYAFDAMTSDYESRFKLVFSQQAPEPLEGPSIPFAYYDGSAWTISNQGPATLQVVDIMGRIVSSETIDGNATVALSQVPGVYMLRLVNGADVKVQKIVVNTTR